MHISEETFDFLRSLRENNDRNWFNENKELYLKSLENIRSIVKTCLDGLSEKDPNLPNDLTVSSTMFRIYRDSRFSQDKTPYKTWFGAALGPEGRKTPGPVYYMHFEPNRSFLALGYWRPEKEHLNAIREEIDYNLPEFESILKNVAKENWSALDNEDKLKKAPKFYSAEHPGIEHLKHRSFTISMELPDELCHHPDMTKIVISNFLKARPFKDFLHQALGGETDFPHTYGGDII